MWNFEARSLNLLWYIVFTVHIELSPPPHFMYRLLCLYKVIIQCIESGNSCSQTTKTMRAASPPILLFISQSASSLSHTHTNRKTVCDGGGMLGRYEKAQLVRCVEDWNWMSRNCFLIRSCTFMLCIVADMPGIRENWKNVLCRPVFLIIDYFKTAT